MMNIKMLQCLFLDDSFVFFLFLSNNCSLGEQKRLLLKTLKNLSDLKLLTGSVYAKYLSKLKFDSVLHNSRESCSY